MQVHQRIELFFSGIGDRSAYSYAGIINEIIKMAGAKNCRAV